MIPLHDFHPLTATPFLQDEFHAEYQPCPALQPYIRCFWGSKRPYLQSIRPSGSDLVVPDACMDLIFNYNYTDNQVRTGFSGISNEAFTSYNSPDSNKYISTFGIRFYAWTAILFADESMEHARNNYIDASHYFPKLKAELEEQFFDCTDIQQRIALAQECLLKHLHPNRENSILNNSINVLLTTKGSIPIASLEQEIYVSTRQLERIYHNYLGISPKQFASMVRYQSLWQTILSHPSQNLLDAVAKFGYTDQSHLLREFKHYHTMTPANALRFALK